MVLCPGCGCCGSGESGSEMCALWRGCCLEFCSPGDGRKDARNMLRNNLLPINHHLLHLIGLALICSFHKLPRKMCYCFEENKRNSDVITKYLNVPHITLMESWWNARHIQVFFLVPTRLSLSQKRSTVFKMWDEKGSKECAQNFANKTCGKRTLGRQKSRWFKVLRWQCSYRDQYDISIVVSFQ